ncbi:ketoacyl-synt-domain-containing protein [Aspergillus campestris IBT 28561]|uniref:Ketoacyl-synt-domain-containing protein n=1 Tax=Aspergillus campestris (strain IBT 28561) TaxID=1392248 RepID=A0A2I1CS27_ASPC2|nr:ketoacyl-synt-domain-containing protein [Aspergillus campestris IBT 28561]PKY00415.1 ketoacyl-synt-domain-containing protein [Aspergillus campestris IBT 28561]
MPHAIQDLEPIAIIGMACRFPGGANSPEELWQMLADGRTGWSEIPADRYTWRSFHHPHPNAEAAHNQKGGGYIDRDLAAFDAAFFNIPAAEANGLDPQQRIHLETAYEALESAGLPLDSVGGSKTSVHVATVSRDYDRNAYRDPQDLAKYQLTGCGEAITSGRVSYTFDLRGPCFSLDTGCSGSLVGLHLAVQGLRSRETDMALVGGTNLLLSPDMTIAMSKLHMLNDDGKCYAFDDRGKGYARSEGVSTIVLKRLSDALDAGDPIRAIVRNTGINQDGKTNGIMLPSSQAQEDLMRSIHLNAGLNPSMTSYVEAHGTGTQAGDNAEINSISKVFCDNIQRSQPLLVGSVKANLGHCESASGLAGLIKTVLALEKGFIPATPDLLNVKDGLDLAKRNIRIPQRLEEWSTAGLRRAAINSFGYGGTNVAAILEAFQPDQRSNGANSHNGISEAMGINGADSEGNLFVVSAKSPRSLINSLNNLKQWVGSQPHLPSEKFHQLAYTLSERRSKFAVRTSFVASTVEEFLAAASRAIDRQPERAASKPKLTLIFTGQGAQWHEMGRELLHTQSSFANSMRESEEILRNLGSEWSLIEMLTRDQATSRINESEISQPATTALQIALVDLLNSFSVYPDSVVGHSSGEIAAAYAVGALSRSGALYASFHRSKVSQLVKQVTSTPGGMLVTTLNEITAYSYINRIGSNRLSLACINSPSSTTISGDMDALKDLKALLDGESIMAKLLSVDVAYHSHHMKAVADQYLNALQGLETFEACEDIQFFSSVTGELKVSGFGPHYWVQNLVSTVRFPDALLASCGGLGVKPTSRVIMEVGPHSALAGPTKQTLMNGPNKVDHKYASALVRGNNAYSTVLNLAGKLFEWGIEVDIEAVNAINSGAKMHNMVLDLPPYAWDYSNHYWHESRLSKEYRFRKYPYHELLGLRLVGSTPLEPLWRNILSIDAQPWLSEHVIDGFAILPGSSFLTMAMEATCQLNDERGARKIKRFHLKQVNYSKAIMIPESPGKVEVMISFSALSAHGTGFPQSSNWERFQITSSADAQTWSLNCVGHIRLEYETERNEVDGGREELQGLSDLRNRLQQTREACTQPIEHNALYEEMRRNGIDYGKYFATIKELLIGECQALGKVVIPDVAQCMPSRYQQPHTIHPATFDALMHIVLPLYFRHCTVGTAMLTSIEEVTVTADITTIPGSQLDVCAALSPSGPRSGSVDVTAFQKDGDETTPVVVLRGQKFQGIATSVSSAPTTYISRPLHRVQEPLKMTIATPGVVSSLCFVADEIARAPLRPDEVEVKALAFGLDAADVDVILGRRGDSVSIGECAGTITAVGSDLTHSFQIGERVCAWNTSVAFASRTRVKSAFVQKIPISWSFKLAAALPRNISLAYYCLRSCAQVESGQTVLVHNAGGALGHAVGLVANILGVRVVATVKTKAEKQALQSFTATRAAHILYSEGVALSKALLRLTEGAGVDVIFNASSTALPIELAASVKAFGTVVDLSQQSTSFAIADRATKYISFDVVQLLRHLPIQASAAFKTVLSLLRDGDMNDLVPVSAVSISDVASAFKAVQDHKNVGKTVLLAGEDAVVNVKEAVASRTLLTNVDRIIKAVNELSVSQNQKQLLLDLISHPGTAGAGAASIVKSNGASLSTPGGRMGVGRRLEATTSLQEARTIILEEQIKKISSLVSVNAQQLDLNEPLVDLGLDSLIAIEFKNWLAQSLGADVRVHDILDANNLEGLADLVAQRSKFVPDGLPERFGKTLSLSGGQQASNLQQGDTGIAIATNNNATHSTNLTENDQLQPSNQSNGSIPNKCPKFPLPPLDAILDAYLTGVKAFATPEEFENTARLTKEFKKPGSKGTRLYDLAVARHTDPDCENWEHELQLHAGFLDRRSQLVWSNFWFSHPLSKHQHSQAERAALLTLTATQFKLRLEAGLVKPTVLNEQELTTAYRPYIFNSVRIPRVGSDEIQRDPSATYCVVFWRGHAFQLDLLVGGQPAAFIDYFQAFRSILSQDLDRSNLPIFTSDYRPSWDEARDELQLLDPMNAASIATIESSAFIVALDEATPLTATERARQFHFGGHKDAANRWQDKSIQFVVCSNGASGFIGEHSMLDALTLTELLDDQATAIRSHAPLDDAVIPENPALSPMYLPLKTNPTLETRILEVQRQYAATTEDAEHAYLLFEGYGSAFLRAHRLSPKSVFQMVVQLAALATFGFTPPCWETVNQAHYHLGRVDIIQVIVPAVARFIRAAGDSSIPLSKRRVLLVEAIRAHVNTINKAGRNLGWERNLTALKTLAATPEDVPELYQDPVYNKVRPRLLTSHCFETGMMEKGHIWRDPKAIWSHYEVYDQSVYFSVVTLEAHRASRFCKNLEEAAGLMKEIILAAEH